MRKHDKNIETDVQETDGIFHRGEYGAEDDANC